MRAKRAFESFAESHSVTIKHCHADNGRFAVDKGRFAVEQFLKDARENGQGVTFCGVDAHWQNGRAEKRIRNLQDIAKTMLVHAVRTGRGLSARTCGHTRSGWQMMCTTKH